MRLPVTRRVPFVLAAALLLGTTVSGSAVADEVAGMRPAGVDPAESLTTEQKTRRAAEDVGAIKDVLATVLDRLAEAREEQDIVQINCINSKLQGIKGLLRVSEQGEVGLKEAAARKEEELINHESTKISLARQRVENLLIEVEGCVGEHSSYTGETDVGLTVDSDIIESDPTVEEPVVAFAPIDSDRPLPMTGSR